MVSQKDSKWKRFEKFVAKVQSSFSPDAEVQLDERVIGRKSGVKRQLDITVRKNVGQFQIFIVIECKDYSNPVDVKHVEEFVGLLDDVGANKGAMVAANGFTKAAKTRARNAGVDLYRLVDAEEHEWQSYVSIPVVCDFRGLGPGRFRIGGSNLILQELAIQDTRFTPLYDEHHNWIGTPLILMWEKWNRGELPTEPGSYVDINLADSPIFVEAWDKHFEKISLAADINVVQNLYFGQLPLVKVIGFRDEVTGDLLLPSNTEIITDWLDPLEVEASWQRIPSMDTLAVKPVMILKALDRYPVEQGLVPRSD